MFEPMIAEVRSTTMLSPNFKRIVFGGEHLKRCTPAEPVRDQRIKLLFGLDPNIDLGDDWYQTWKQSGVGDLRTYTIRSVETVEGEMRIAVDFVLHGDSAGPASAWAQAASVGDRLLFVGPTVPGEMGVDFLPGSAREIVLAGDETAVPAIASILDGLGDEFSGTAFCEVPTSEDLLDDVRHPNFEVRWLPRDGRAHGELLAQEVLRAYNPNVEVELDFAEEVDGLLWETPTFSSKSEQLEDRDESAQRYYWIAGESGLVTGVRRVLVKEYEIPRSQVSFMGYWRKGRAS